MRLQATGQHIMGTILILGYDFKKITMNIYREIFWNTTTPIERANPSKILSLEIWFAPWNPKPFSHHIPLWNFGSMLCFWTFRGLSSFAAMAYYTIRLYHPTSSQRPHTPSRWRESCGWRLRWWPSWSSSTCSWHGRCWGRSQGWSWSAFTPCSPNHWDEWGEDPITKRILFV